MSNDPRDFSSYDKDNNCDDNPELIENTNHQLSNSLLGDDYSKDEIINILEVENHKKEDDHSSSLVNSLTSGNHDENKTEITPAENESNPPVLNTDSYSVSEDEKAPSALTDSELPIDALSEEPIANLEKSGGLSDEREEPSLLVQSITNTENDENKTEVTSTENESNPPVLNTDSYSVSEDEKAPSDPTDSELPIDALSEEPIANLEKSGGLSDEREEPSLLVQSTTDTENDENKNSPSTTCKVDSNKSDQIPEVSIEISLPSDPVEFADNGENNIENVSSLNKVSKNKVADLLVNDTDVDKKTSTHNPNKATHHLLSKKTRKRIETIAQIVAIAAVIMPFTAFILSAVKAISFSHYFNIPLQELANVSTAIDYVADILPIILIFLFIFYPIKHIELSLASSSRGFAEIISEILIIFVFTLIDTLYISYYCLDSISFAFPSLYFNIKISALVWLIMFIITLLFSYLAYFSFCNKKKVRKNKKIAKPIFVILILILSVFFVIIPFMARISTKTFLPQNLTEYETVKIDNDNYIVICNSPNGKIIMKYYPRGNEYAFIDNSSYRYLQLDKSEVTFKYRHFTSVKINK